MKNIVITGGKGFLGQNLVAHLSTRSDCETRVIGRTTPLEELERALHSADVVFHLAGVNRPKDQSDFYKANVGFTQRLCALLRAAGRTPKIVFSSSIQASLDNPYGTSKRDAEGVLLTFAVETGARVRIYRLKNIFGKWCRPNYNSVTATFCHNIANGIPIFISNPANEIELSYVDDVVGAFIAELEGEADPESIPCYPIRLGELAGRIQSFHAMRETLTIANFHDAFNRDLFATYSSYVPPCERMFRLRMRSDDRGSLAEFLKSQHAGQIFVSRTLPGITRGNHYHHTKTEQFLVVEGDGLIRMRHIASEDIQEYRVRGCEYQVISIPPGFTHSITNVGGGEMVTLFWASEIFDPDRPDTYFLPVDGAPMPLLENRASEQASLEL